MREIHGRDEASVPAPAQTVFGLITDLRRLPRWNAAIAAVEAPPPALAPGAAWTVQMHPARGMRWGSVSTIREIDPSERRFTYRTVNADGNPSYTMWAWQVTSDGAASTVSVTWDVYLKTWDRRLLAGPIRRRQLRHEVAASLRALAEQDPTGAPGEGV